MEEYKTIGRIGEGAYGHVSKARNIRTKELVALKKVFFKSSANGIPLSILREIKILQLVHHKYVVELINHFLHDNLMVLVFHFMPSGLWEMINDFQNPLTTPILKSYMQMLLKGVGYLHSQFIMHRDLKPANLLIDNKGILKIADFGLSRFLWKASDGNGQKEYTHEVATRWYRAPELLYGSRNYNETVDLWAVGCIFAEMVNKSVLFPGENDIEQLVIVLHKLGTPTTESWPGLKNLPDYNKITFSVSEAVPFDVLIPDADDLCVDLIKSFLSYNSEKRLPANEALIHKYFFTPPLPCPEENMPVPTEDHRQRVRKQAEPSYDIFENMFQDISLFLN